MITNITITAIGMQGDFRSIPLLSGINRRGITERVAAIDLNLLSLVKFLHHHWKNTDLENPYADYA